MKRTNTMIMTTVILSAALIGILSIDAADELTTNSLIPMSMIVDAELDGVKHEITMNAVKLPDGMYAYEMERHLICENGEANCDPMDDDVTSIRYSSLKASVPGPTLVFTEGDVVNVTLNNKTPCEDFPIFVDGGEDQIPEIAKIGIHVHGVHYSSIDDGTPERTYGHNSSAYCGDSVTYEWRVEDGSRGVWPYHDHTFKSEHGAEDLGLFGAILVNPRSGEINGIISSEDDTEGQIVSVEVDEIKKDFVLWMVSTETLGRSIFYGMEIDYDGVSLDSQGIGKQTPLWVNPTLYAEEGEKYRFHILGMGDEVHAFHLHGHKWIEPIEFGLNLQAEVTGGGPYVDFTKKELTGGNIIDVREISPLEKHTFIIEASDNGVDAEGTEDWMYHCHFYNHMEEGMAGKFRVVEDDTLPTIGAVFTLSDEPGLWMKTLDAGVLDNLDDYLADVLGAESLRVEGIGFAPTYLGALNENFADTEARSLAVINKGESVLYNMKDSQTVHTITTLVWPTAGSDAFTDVELPVRGTSFVADEDGLIQTYDEPGLYVNICKIHPYMFSAIVVDDPLTNLPSTPESPFGGNPAPLLEIGEEFSTLIDTSGAPFPELTDGTLDIYNEVDQIVIKALLKTHFHITDPANWKDYTQPTWSVNVVPAFVTPKVHDGEPLVVIRPDTTTQVIKDQALALLGLDLDEEPLASAVVPLGLEIDSDNMPTGEIKNPKKSGIGEVWVNTQFELTTNKNFDGTPSDKPGTITVVDTENWTVEKKISLPEINMNHPHNMWTDAKNEVVYQTQWFDNTMTSIDRETGELIKNGFVGESPSHVMTLPDGERAGNLMIAMNGEEQITEIDPNTQEIVRQISTGVKSHPHGHWISTDGRFMVTPNPFTNTSTIIDFGSDQNASPSISLVDTQEYPIATGMMPDSSKYFVATFLGNTIDVINPETGSLVDSVNLLTEAGGVGLPIQTPVSPDGKYMVTANVLDLLGTGGITIIDTTDSDNPIIGQLPCDPGCHGVQWGARDGDGYYAYVSSKFSNALIVVDPGYGTDEPEIVGKVLLTEQFDTDSDDRIIGYDGMGGQGILAIPNVYDGWIQQTVEECSDSKGKFKKSGPCGEELTGFLKDLKKNQLNPQDYRYTEEPEDDD